MPSIKTPFQIFLSDTVDRPNSLPNQLFRQNSFDFLLTIGGDLVDNEEEFDAFMSFLKELGENELFIQEHSTQFGKPIPFEKRFPVSTKYSEYEKLLREYSDFGLQIASWFVYGNSQDWGIYLAEQPTINIIGCKQSLTDKFRQIFKVSNSGYGEIKDFVKKEFGDDELIEQFETNYKLTSK